MSEPAAEPATADAPPAAKPRRRLLVPLVAGGLVLLLGLGGGGYLWLARRGGGPVAAPEAERPVFRELPEMVVRLDGGRGAYLKLVAVLDLEDEQASAQVERLEPRLLDSLQTYLVELTAADLVGAGRLDLVRQELLRRANGIAPASTRDILFKTLILQ